MRKLFLLFGFVAMTANAQDVIVKKDGSTILSKVIKIGTSEVEYKKFSNQNGPTYSILKSDILAINYENGEKDTFADTKQPLKQETENKQQIITATPAADNSEIISRYNKIYEHGKTVKDKDKTADEGYCILGVGENSVLSTNDITVEFRQDPYISSYIDGSPMYRFGQKYYVQIHNKTDKIIYLDLGSTFRVMKNGTSKVYFNNSQTTVTSGSGSGVGVNLGAVAGAVGIGGGLGTLANGVSVGGGSSTSTSKTYAKQRVVAVPPHGKVPLEKYEVIKIKSSKSEVISDGEELLYGYAKGSMPQINFGEKFFYNEGDSPYHADYTIMYSYDSDFTTAFSVKASVYMRELIGASNIIVSYWDLQWINSYDNPQKSMVKMQERITDYNEYTIVGNFGYSHKAYNK